MIFSSLKVNALSVAALLPLASAHSWLECADYDATPAELADFKFGDYDVAKCRGFPRPLDNGARGVGRQAFGTDIGMDKQTTRSDDAAQCNVPPVAESAYGAYPMAEYKQGGTYTLAWPAKNHAAAECTGPNIPDSGLEIFASGVNPTEDPNHSTFQATRIPSTFGEGGNPGPHVGNTIDMKGFQRCMDFCANTDKAFCFGEITIPEDMAVGTYTFQWYWEFNPGQIYITCFDVKVGAAEAGGTPTDDTSNDTPVTGGDATPAPVTNGELPDEPVATQPEPVAVCDLTPDTNSIAIKRMPSWVITGISTFFVDLCYTATTEIQLVGEVIRNGKSIGYGSVTVQPDNSGTAWTTLPVQGQSGLAKNDDAWLVVWSAEYENYKDWEEAKENGNVKMIGSFELSKRMAPLTVSDSGTGGSFYGCGVLATVLATLVAIWH